MASTSMSAAGIASEMFHHRLQPATTSSAPLDLDSSVDATSSRSTSFSANGGASRMASAGVYVEGGGGGGGVMGGIGGSGSRGAVGADGLGLICVRSEGASRAASPPAVAAGIPAEPHLQGPPVARELELREKSIAAGAAAVLSALVVNPLDVAKTRLQAQAAGGPYAGPSWNYTMTSPRMEKLLPEAACPPMCPRIGNVQSAPLCNPECFTYKNTLDVFQKVARQEGFRQLWRGTSAALLIAVPSVGVYLPCYDVILGRLEATSLKDFSFPVAPLLAGAMSRSVACSIVSPLEVARTRMQARKEFKFGGPPAGVATILRELVITTKDGPGFSWSKVRLLWVGTGAQLARDVPFSAICWCSLEPVRRRLLQWAGPEAGLHAVVGSNMLAGMVAGATAAGLTCPLDVVKTRRQIEVDPIRRQTMTTASTLKEIWRKAGMKGMFVGVVPRCARAAPSVGIVVSFYEMVKYFLHGR